MLPRHVCSSCRRHLNAVDGGCPFCGAQPSVSGDAVARLRLGPAVLISMLGLASCVSESDEGGGSADTLADGDVSGFDSYDYGISYGGGSFTYSETNDAGSSETAGDETSGGVDTITSTDGCDDAGEDAGVDTTIDTSAGDDTTGDCDPSTTGGETGTETGTEAGDADSGTTSG